MASGWCVLMRRHVMPCINPLVIYFQLSLKCVQNTITIENNLIKLTMNSFTIIIIKYTHVFNIFFIVLRDFIRLHLFQLCINVFFADVEIYCSFTIVLPANVP